MKRELIIPGNISNSCHLLLQPLIGKFHDELDQIEKAIYESVEPYGEFWFAEWDESTNTLSTKIDDVTEFSLRISGWPLGKILPIFLKMLSEANDM